MRCVILVAGTGKRMMPLTENRAKCMLPVANKPILEYLINAVSKVGIRNIVLVTNHGKDGIVDYFAHGSKFGVNIEYVNQSKKNGTGAALLSAKQHVRERFLVLNGDSIVDFNDIVSVISAGIPAMGIVRSPHPEEYGVVSTKDGKVTGICEKPTVPENSCVNAGVYLFDQRVFTYLEALKPSIRGEFELTDALLPYIENGELCAAEMKGWINVEHPWDLLDANRCVLNRTGSVYGENTEIMPGCTIESPCYIGSDCVIGPNAYIRRYTSIGNNCRIGNAVEIKNSIIMDGTKIPHFSYVGDSVIGRNCNIGAGAMIANLRHDDATVIAHFLYRPGVSTGKRKFGAVMGDNVKIGINCPIMPGMMIESGRKIVLNTRDLTVL